MRQPRSHAPRGTHGRDALRRTLAAIPMRILVFEYTCAGDLTGRPELEGLRAEGEAMQTAVCEDLARLPGIEVRTLGIRGVDNFRAEARAADAVLVIAPESDGMLAAYCRWAEEAGGLMLGPSSAAAQLCGDKLALGGLLRSQGLAVPESRRFDPAEEQPSRAFPAVIKPRDGAGSAATFLVRSREELDASAGQARAEGWAGELIVQPFVAGRPASVAFLMGPGRIMPLLPAEQHLSADGRFHYRGGAVPLAPELGERAVRLARRAVEAVPGLRGYVGVDVVLGEAGDWVIEVNPRLTTSYLGLRALAETNLAEAMLRLARGQDAGTIHWRAGRVCFTVDGRVS